MQRIRIRVARGEEIKYVGHLDFIRFWERAVRRAALPLASTEGHHPHPRLALAAPLPVGYTSEAELLDIFLERLVAPQEVIRRLTAQMPPGVRLLEAVQLDPQAPSLQSLMRACSYRLEIGREERTVPDVEAAIAGLMALETLPWEWQRDDEVKQIDLRLLIEEVRLEDADEDSFVLALRVIHDSNASGRPELVVQALGFTEHPLGLHRTQIMLKRTYSVPAVALSRRGKTGGRGRSVPSSTVR